MLHVLNVVWVIIHPLSVRTLKPEPTVVYVICRVPTGLNYNAPLWTFLQSHDPRTSRKWRDYERSSYSVWEGQYTCGQSQENESRIFSGQIKHSPKFGQNIFSVKMCDSCVLRSVAYFSLCKCNYFFGMIKSCFPPMGKCKFFTLGHGVQVFLTCQGSFSVIGCYSG